MSVTVGVVVSSSSTVGTALGCCCKVVVGVVVVGVLCLLAVEVPLDEIGDEDVGVSGE